VSESDLIKTIVMMAIVGGAWTVFGYDHWGHFYIALGGIVLAVVVYAVMNAFGKKSTPPSPE